MSTPGDTDGLLLLLHIEELVIKTHVSVYIQ